MFIYEGMLAALTGQTDEADHGIDSVEAPLLPGLAAKQPIESLDLAEAAHHRSDFAPAQTMMATEDIEFGYCTEFLVNLVPGKVKGLTFDEGRFRRELSKHGDSLLVVADDDLVKIHIHAEYPGEVMTLAQQYGDLSRIKIENMRDQHTHILEEARHAFGNSADADSYAVAVVHSAGPERKRYGMITVSVGEGISEIFTSLGVDYVLSGGQTMNPSTEDIVNAAREISAQTIFLFCRTTPILLWRRSRPKSWWRTKKSS